MREETPEETFAHLTDKDSIAMLIPVMEGRPFSPGYYPSDVKIVTKMTRIRKLLDDAKKSPDSISSFLQDQLLTIMSEQYSLAYDEHLELTKKGQTSFKDIPDDIKYRLLSTTAVYVLSEMNSYESLPVLNGFFAQGKAGRNPDFGGSCQVNPKFLFYAMHRLVEQFPDDQLSEEAQQSRTNYLTIAKRLGVPGAKRTYLTTWEAYYHEDDYRKRVLGKSLYEQYQPTIELTIFPPLNKFSQRSMERLRKNMSAFIKVAFAV